MIIQVNMRWNNPRDYYLLEFTVPEGECGKTFSIGISSEKTIINYLCNSETNWSQPGNIPECSKCFLEITKELVRQRPLIGELFNEVPNK